jgi:tetratricopeptide (TPR) repeat protein
VRALTTLAKMTSGEIDRTAVAILERAIAVIGPRTSWCTALVEALEALGDTEMAAVWSERCVSLCPSDMAGLVKHLDRLVRTADTGRLADALAWVLSRPFPRQAIAQPFTNALRELSRLDAAQGAVVARRALDVLGPKDPSIREAMLFAATTACDDAFVVAIFERALACEPSAADREKLLVGLAELYERLDDEDAEARVTTRAIREGVRSAAIEAHVKRLEGRSGSPDARIWRLQAQAMDLSSADDAAAVALAWRRLGAALWDMAEDQAGALAAWQKAASFAAASGGYAALAADLVTFAGESFATAHLTRLVESESDAPTAAAMAAEVARAALLYGAPRAALDLAALGVARHPASADALEAAEASALQLRDFATLSGLYDRVAQKALGRFGDRAAHYRAARFFERIAEAPFALKHAISAFRALPSDGSVFRLLARAGERSADRREAVRALEHAAAAARSSAMQAEWLLRAAALTSDGVEGRRQRIDLLLRAVVTHPDPSTVESLAKAVTDSLGREPEDREDVELRVLHAAHSVASGVAGPQGARVAIAFASLVLDPLGIVDAALELTVRAFDCDMSVDEFGRLHAAAGALARAHGVKECLDELISKVAPPSHAGVSGLRLVEKIAKATADARLVARVERELRTKDAPADLATQTSRPVSIDEVATPQVRADRWTEIAERREARGDLEGAVRAQTEACKLDSETLGRWSVLERLAEIAEDAESRVLALENIASRVGADGRIPVFKRLARAHRDRRDFRAAESAWRSVLALDSADDDADQAIESIFVATARYSELAAHLAARARQIQADPTRVESLRAIRLRRAAILEQRLGLLDDACQELEHVLSEAPDNPSALRYLADLLERKGARGRAAELWARAAVLERDTEERDDLNLRAGRAAAATGDFTQAFGHAERVLSRSPENRAAHDLRCEAARSLGWDEELGDALERSAAVVDLSSERKSELLVDASLASARAGDLDTALARAALAANAAPEHATAQLLARGLEYRLRGPGTEEQARMTVEELGRLGGPLGDDDVALQAFLLAEALDVFHTDASGLRRLEEAEQMTGHHALLSLGIAERLAADGQAAEALGAYREALKGPLLGLRPVANVALSAVDTALYAGRTRDAMEFLDIAERYPEGKEAAIARRRQLAPSLSQEPSSGSRPKSTGSSRPSPFVPGRRGTARVALAKERVSLGDIKDAERLLRNALADGFVDAGDELVSLLQTLPERNAEIAQVRRVQVSIEPGQRARMDALHAAVVANGDQRYALAIEHVLRAFTPVSERLPAPSLFSQPVQSGVLALLTRPSTDDVGEALALIWEGASQVFLRDATSYGITGLERIVPGPTSPLSKLYDGVIRLLQAPRIPLFAPKSEAEPTRAHVALLSPPSVILTGDSRQDVAEVRFELGRGISAALPQHVLLMGLSASEGQTLIDALLAGFGPPDSSRGITTAAARMAETFWQRLPARAQRRLQQILGSGVQFDYAALRARANQSGQRVGMFLAGDFGLAARVVVAERAPDAGAPSFETLRELCQTVPDLADLFRLAVSPEYADARWHEEGTLARSPSGRFTLL